MNKLKQGDMVWYDWEGLSELRPEHKQEAAPRRSGWKSVPGRGNSKHKGPSRNQLGIFKELVKASGAEGMRGGNS